MGEVMLAFIRFNTGEVFRGVLLIFLADGTFWSNWRQSVIPKKPVLGKSASSSAYVDSIWIFSS